MSVTSSLTVCLLLVAGLISPSSSSMTKIVTVSDETNRGYPAIVAPFGAPVTNAFQVDLMVPPTGKDLCQVPEVGPTDNVFRISPVALLVNNTCQAIQQARVVKALKQSNLTLFRAIEYLLVYNSDLNNMEGLLLPQYNRSAPEYFQSIAILSISTKSGIELTNRIEQKALDEKIAPQYLHSSSSDWTMRIDIEENKYPTLADEQPEEALFKQVIFAILMLTPCCRACYLWYAGGGRVRLRYSETGRVVGLQYIPPMPYWFAPRPGPDSFAYIAVRLTREEVLALPEVIFQSPSTDETLSSGSENKSSLDEGCDGERESLPDDCDSKKSSNSSDTSASAADEEQPPDVQTSAPRYLGSCTTCSICIEDFEPGERVRLLPRCRHVFHTECIMPWLIERQGCCPTCKTDVKAPIEPVPEQLVVDQTEAQRESDCPEEPQTTEQSQGEQTHQTNDS